MKYKDYILRPDAISKWRSDVEATTRRDTEEARQRLKLAVYTAYYKAYSNLLETELKEPYPLAEIILSIYVKDTSVWVTAMTGGVCSGETTSAIYEGRLIRFRQLITDCCDMVEKEEERAATSAGFASLPLFHRYTKTLEPEIDKDCTIHRYCTTLRIP